MEVPLGQSIDVTCSGFFCNVTLCGTECDIGWVHNRPFNLRDFDHVSTNTSQRVYVGNTTWVTACTRKICSLTNNENGCFVFFVSVIGTFGSGRKMTRFCRLCTTCTRYGWLPISFIKLYGTIRKTLVPKNVAQWRLKDRPSFYFPEIRKLAHVTFVCEVR